MTDEYQRAVDLIIEMRDQQVRASADRIRQQLAGFVNHHPVANLPVIPTALESIISRLAAKKKEAKVATLHAAIEAYVVHMGTKRVSDAYRWRARQILDGLKTIRKDCPMVDTNDKWIDQLRSHYTDRPKSEHTGRPISVETVHIIEISEDVF